MVEKIVIFITYVHVVGDAFARLVSCISVSHGVNIVAVVDSSFLPNASWTWSLIQGDS